MQHLLNVQGLTTAFSTDRGPLTAVEDVSFWVDEGETVCLVGESSCGKSVTAQSLLGLLPRGGRVTGGTAQFQEQDLLRLSEAELDRVRGSRISMVFQDALSGLNPVFTIGNQLTESLRAHQKLSRAQALAQAARLLRRVGLPQPEAALKKYPHTLSGGQRQRVMIAMALACNPRLLIADEPTTALDVTIQAQIMELLRRLRQESGMSLMLITHDLGLVAQNADRVLVMYAGQIVEQAPVNELFDRPLHPYTRALLDSVPHLQQSRPLESIPGTVPENYTTITGCRFAGRCPHALPACNAPQPFADIGGGRAVRCARYNEVNL